MSCHLSSQHAVFGEGEHHDCFGGEISRKCPLHGHADIFGALILFTEQQEKTNPSIVPGENILVNFFVQLVRM